MKKTTIFIFGLLLTVKCFSQNSSNWTPLDYLNNDSEYPFQTEKDIEGLCFITLSESFDYYQTPIIIKDRNNKQIVRIEFVDTLGILTTYKEKQYKSYDTLNPFNPWLWVDNPDYFRLVFECTDSIGDFYKVKVNENDFGWIEKTDKSFKKESIIEFVLNWTIEPMGLDFNRAKNPLRSKPDDNSQTIEHFEKEKYRIWKAESLDIQGDWMKIKTIKDEVGWIKWREGKKVLIKMYYAC